MSFFVRRALANPNNKYGLTKKLLTDGGLLSTSPRFDGWVRSLTRASFPGCVQDAYLDAFIVAIVQIDVYLSSASKYVARRILTHLQELFMRQKPIDALVAAESQAGACAAGMVFLCGNEMALEDFLDDPEKHYRPLTSPMLNALVYASQTAPSTGALALAEISLPYIKNHLFDDEESLKLIVDTYAMEHNKETACQVAYAFSFLLENNFLNSAAREAVFHAQENALSVAEGIDDLFRSSDFQRFMTPVSENDHMMDSALRPYLERLVSIAARAASPESVQKSVKEETRRIIQEAKVAVQRQESPVLELAPLSPVRG